MFFNRIMESLEGCTPSLRPYLRAVTPRAFGLLFCLIFGTVCMALVSVSSHASAVGRGLHSSTLQLNLDHF